MFKTRFISILALLCLTVSGAWAQEVTLLTTIENTGDNASFTSGSKTFDNIATVTFSGTVYNDDDDWGWYYDEECTLTVTAAEGYTITRVKFYTRSGSAFDEEAPFEAILLCDDEGGYFTKVNGTSIGDIGVTNIEVYGYAGTPEPATVAVTGVTLAQTSATLTAGGAALELTPTVAPEGATDKTVKWSVEQTGDFVALYTDEACTQAVGTDAIAAAKVYVKPLAAGQATITVTTTDGAKTATCAVTVAEPTYNVTFKAGTEDATSWTIAPAEATTTGVAAGTTVTATYSGTKKVKSVKAKKAVPFALNISNPAVGQVIGSDGINYAYTSLPNGVTAVAKICYISGNNGLALAMADENGEMDWGAANTAAAAHEPACTSGGTWRLASKNEWDNMIGAAGGASNLRDGFSSVGGTNMQASGYWSSYAPVGGYHAWYPFGGSGWQGSPDNNKYYVRACLAFTVEAPAARPLAEATTDDLGKIAGKDGKIYATKADAEAVATGNAVAMIAYVGTASDCTHGLAIALADESGTKDYGAAGTACSGKAAVTGGTWRLPSEKDWQYMFIGCGSSESYSAPTPGMSKSYSGLASKLTTAQGDALQTDFYWSSTEVSPGDLAWLVLFGGSNANFFWDDEGSEYKVRACLAF